MEAAVSALEPGGAPVTPGGSDRLGGGGAFPVDVRSLGKELRRLWEATPEAQTPGNAVLTRACTRNVVVLADDAAQAARAADVVARVADRHPARAFLVRAETGPDADPDRLEAFLEARCLVRGGGRHVWCEQITLAVGANARRRAAGAIVPLLVPDLPVFVWALDDVRWDDEFLRHLLSVADRFVVDSRAVADPAALAHEFARIDPARRWAPGDFEWSRLAPWREAIAAQFDEPLSAGLAHVFDRVCVKVGAGGTGAGAALLAGWAVDRMARARELAGADGAAPRAELEAVAGAPPGQVLEVRFCCDDPDAHSEIVVEASDSTLTARVDVPDACGLPSRHPLAALSEESLLEDQLDAPGRSPVYENALRRAVALVARAV